MIELGYHPVKLFDNYASQLLESILGHTAKMSRKKSFYFEKDTNVVTESVRYQIVRHGSLHHSGKNISVYLVVFKCIG